MSALGAATGAAVTAGGEQLVKAGAAFLDSVIGKVILTLVAGIVTGGAGAAIVGPVLAAIGPTLPALLLGETTFLSDWADDLLAYTNAPIVIAVPGLSEAIGADTAKAMLHIQQVKIGPHQKTIDKRVMDHDFAGGFLDSPEVFSEWYRKMMMEVIGPDAKFASTPEELSAKLGIRQDSAAMAISVWNGTTLPDMKKYDQLTGMPRNQAAQSADKGGSLKADILSHVQSTTAQTSVTSSRKADTLASAGQPLRPSTNVPPPEPDEKVRQAVPFVTAGLGVGGALLLGAALPVVGVAGLALGGIGYLLARK